ncbi:MAG: type II toxin-antitoxin system PemK/MazF family toxin [Acidobacteria bacterium]|nr:type II toxin-antitoxin system PemK/MazF family toxin [Acidobacteriota bacterium]
MKPGDVVVGVLEGAAETKVRPAVVIASAAYLAERPDVVVGILTTRMPRPVCSTDYALRDWQLAGLRARSWFRVYVLTVHRSELTVIGRLSERDWGGVRECVGRAFAG